MSSSWPQSIDNFGQVTGTESTNHPNTAGLTHADLHNLLADAVTKLETNLQKTSTATQLSFFPANPTGLSTITMPDEVTGTITWPGGYQAGSATSNRTELVLAEDQSLLVVRTTGDASPRWVIPSDPTDGLFASDGTVDPYALGATFFVDRQINGGAFAVSNLRNNGTFSAASPSYPEFRIAGNAFYVASQDPNTLTFSPSPTSWNNAFAFYPGNGLYWYNYRNTTWESLSGGAQFPVASQPGQMIYYNGSNWVATNWEPIGVNNSIDSGITGNDAFGADALRSLNAPSGGAYNTAVGSDVLRNFTSGYYNVGVGFEALYSLTGANYNTAVGWTALNTSTTDQYNTAVGAAAMSASSGASYSVAVGYQALKNDISSGGNVAIGYQSGLTNSTGWLNTFVGYQSAQANTTGGANTAVGYQALLDNTTGNNNSAFGLALSRNTTGSDNTAIGNACLEWVTTGNKNTGIGSFVGAVSGNDLSTGTGNTLIGYGAITSGTSNPSYGLALGYQTGIGASGAVAIGTDHTGAAASSSTQDLIVIGTTNHTTNIPGSVNINTSSTGSGIQLIDPSAGIFIEETGNGSINIQDTGTGGLYLKDTNSSGQGINFNSATTVVISTGSKGIICQTGVGTAQSVFYEANLAALPTPTTTNAWGYTADGHIYFWGGSSWTVKV